MAEALRMYGCDEELWREVLKGHYWTGERDVELVEALLRRKGQVRSVLDLGCGVGRISNRLAARGFKVTGIDLSSRCIEEARRIAEETGVSKNTDYIVGDYREFCADPGGHGVFDAAICILAPAWSTLSEMSTFFNSLSRKVREGGFFILIDVVKERLLNLLTSLPSAQNWFTFSGNILSLHTWRYDPVSSRIRAKKELYRRDGECLRFITKIEREYDPYSISDYIRALSHRWRVEDVYLPPISIARLEQFNDPWWLFSAIITAERI
ncbi:MAG: class I SAM-dependent methyltransferase [Candidatus Nezhaarchaeota archaeon]|nr:class I SAM-dependent methyltransferase [Candidatus Nezhaarchaeota archaeon]